MAKGAKSIITVKGTAITILSQKNNDFISLRDMVRNFEGEGALIENWLRKQGYY